MNNDSVNRPAHYTDGKIEVIDFIEDKKLNFHRGNAVKYISRAGKKDPAKEIEDLEKARWYINREIERLKAQVAVKTVSDRSCINCKQLDNLSSSKICGACFDWSNWEAKDK